MDEQEEPGRRQRSAETRRLLLQAGVDIVRSRVTQSGDEVVAAALAHVRLTQVASRATELRRTDDPRAPAVTTGAIYNLWPSQVDYQADLLLHIADIQATMTVDVEAARAGFEKAAAAEVPLVDVLRAVVEGVRQKYRENALFAVELGFLASSADPRVKRALHRRQDAYLASAEQAWQCLLDSYGLSLRPSYTSRHLAIAISSQFVGSVALWYGNPATDDDPAGEEGWGLAARSIAAIFDAMTLPADADNQDGASVS